MIYGVTLQETWVLCHPCLNLELKMAIADIFQKSFWMMWVVGCQAEEWHVNGFYFLCVCVELLTVV